MSNETTPEFDPSSFIERLESDCPMRREAAARSLGSMGCAVAGRPLAGLLLREVRSVPLTGLIENPDVVSATAESIRVLGATESLYAIIRSLCTMSCCEEVDRTTVESLVECLAEVGGPNVVREAADKVVRHASDACEDSLGIETVAMVLFENLSMCGDAGVRTLRRLANAGPARLQPFASYALAMV